MIDIIIIILFIEWSFLADFILTYWNEWYPFFGDTNGLERNDKILIDHFAKYAWFLVFLGSWFLIVIIFDIIKIIFDS